MEGSLVELLVGLLIGEIQRISGHSFSDWRREAYWPSPDRSGCLASTFTSVLLEERKSDGGERSSREAVLEDGVEDAVDQGGDPVEVGGLFGDRGFDR